MKKRKKPSGRLTAAERRAQLIEVGRAVFAERGYEATSVEEIAARAKVSKPILYDHFGGKEGLYAGSQSRAVPLDSGDRLSHSSPNAILVGLENQEDILRTFNKWKHRQEIVIGR